MVPVLAVADWPAAAPMRRLPYADQTKYLSAGIEYLTESGGVIQVQVPNITDLQKRQLFDARGGVRGLAAQRSWVESEKTRLALQNAAPIKMSPYVIRKGIVTFNEGCEMTRKQLAVLLAQMED